MLIITRKIGEALKIGHSINVKVLKIQGMQVRIGVDAPKEITIHREEVYDLINDPEKPEES